MNLNGPGHVGEEAGVGHDGKDGLQAAEDEWGGGHFGVVSEEEREGEKKKFSHAAHHHSTRSSPMMSDKSYIPGALHESIHNIGCASLLRTRGHCMIH